MAEQGGFAWDLPELDETGEVSAPIRLPESGNVPATPRLRALLDTQPVQRLRDVMQLGLAHLVYPGARHSRFEHSLGTYAMARLLLRHLALQDATATRWLSADDCRTFLAAALLHDTGHYPFSHTLEELPPDPARGIALISHDRRAREVLLADEALPRILEQQWGVAAERLAQIIDESRVVPDAAGRRLQGLLAGPLNPDRLDYLRRDSAHVGVPYGKVVDMERLLGSLRFTPDGQGLGVTAKGVSAVETLIFASYLMYREVYWHHAVRTAQAMLKRAVTEALLRGEMAPRQLVDLNDAQAVALLQACRNPVTADLMARLTGPGRRLYKRVFSCNMAQLPQGEFFDRLSAAGYWEQEQLAVEVCRGLARRLGMAVPEHALLIDVAGRGKELFFSVPVVDRAGAGRSTADPEISLIAPYLSRNFDAQAKQLQLAAPAEWVQPLRCYLGLEPA